MPPKRSRSQIAPGLKYTPRPRPKTKVLNHAIIGDIIGVPYEFVANNIYTTDFELFDDPKRPNLKTIEYQLGHNQKSIYSDDSLTQDYIAEALMETWGKSDEEIVHACMGKLKECARKYDGHVAGGFGPRFVRWAKQKNDEVTHSIGDGSAMRVGAVAWMCNSLEQTLHLAELTAKPSHDHPEAIKGAQAVAAASYLARAGVDKEGIKAYLETKFGYDLDKTVADHRQRNIDRKAVGREQDEICPFVVPMALRAFLEGTNFEDSIRLAVSIGGDSDTIGAMVGAMAGAYYPMSKQLEEECEKRSNDRLREGAKKFDAFIDQLDIEPKMDEVEYAIADAKLKQYILQQAKAGNQSEPEKDPKFQELLAEKEAIRLYYGELNRVLERNDAVFSKDRDLLLYEKMLIEQKDERLQQLKEFIKESPEYKKQLAEMKTWPVETVQVPDWDTNRFDKKLNDYVQDTNPELRIDNKKYPEMVLNNNDILPSLLAPEVEHTVVPEAKNAIEQLNQYIEVLDKNTQQSTNTEEAPESKQIDWAKKTVEKLNELPCIKGEFLSASTPNDKINQNRAAYEEAYRLLGEPDFDQKDVVMDEKKDVNLHDAKSNIASVTGDLRNLLRDQIRTMDAYDEVRNDNNQAHFEKIDAKYRVEDAIKKAMERQPAAKEPSADLLTLGRKTDRYCVAYVVNMVNGENGINEYFPSFEKMPKLLQDAMDDLKDLSEAETTFDRLDYSGEALYKLKKVSKDLSEQLDNHFDEQLVEQNVYITRLIKAVEEVRNAPEVPRDCETHQIVYDRLNASSAAIGNYMETLPVESNMYKLAKLAQESMKNIQQAVAAEAFGEKENGLAKLASTNDYAHVSLYQMMRRITDPKTLHEFEINSLDKSIEKMSKSKACETFRKGATVATLNDVMRTSGGMLDKIADIMKKAQKPIVLDPNKLNLDKKSSVTENGPTNLR